MRTSSWRTSAWAIPVVLLALWAGPPGEARSQPPANADANAPTGAQLAERLRAMEEANRRLSERLEQSTREHDEQIRQLMDRLGTGNRGSNNAGNASSNSNPAEPNRPSSSSGQTSPASEVQQTSGSDGATSTTPGAPSSPVPGYLDLDITAPTRIPFRGSFGPGFMFQTDDEAYRLQIHYESQVEGRVWSEVDQIPATNGMYLPRQRIFFSGNITKPIEYEFAINRGLNNINVLNAFINIHFDDRFELRFGRYFTPFLYEQYAVSNYWLLTPERSLYSTNVGLNRQFGLMAWGYLFEKQLDYAAGVFNGTRNSFENLDKEVDFVAYLNARPFQNEGMPGVLRKLNVGSSFAYGRQNTPPTPVGFRVGAGSPDTAIPANATVPFLILNPDVQEHGDRLQGAVHLAYYYGGLSLLSEWQYGYTSYTREGQPNSTAVALNGFYVAAGYFLTGEEVQQRARVTPRRPFVPLNKDDEQGIGAWELVGRVSRLQIGNAIFSGGFADPDRWANSATTTEVGLNWTWNDYMKIYMFWLNGRFGDPVRYRDDVSQQTVNMFWLRAQLYF